MSRKCELCGKTVSTGMNLTRRGLAKRKGGVGKKIMGQSRRTFRPNIQKVRAVVNGTVRPLKVCTACIRAGAVTKAP